MIDKGNNDIVNQKEKSLEAHKVTQTYVPKKKDLVPPEVKYFSKEQFNVANHAEARFSAGTSALKNAHIALDNPNCNNWTSN